MASHHFHSPDALGAFFALPHIGVKQGNTRFHSFAIIEAPRFTRTMNILNHATFEALQNRIVDSVDQIVTEAERESRPLELNPARSELFALFADAEAAGCLKEDADVNLSAEALCSLLGERWGLKDAARESVEQESRLPGNHLSRMRSLWSLMRMWIEWTYAWQRWDEFHHSPRQPR